MHTLVNCLKVLINFEIYFNTYSMDKQILGLITLNQELVNKGLIDW